MMGGNNFVVRCCTWWSRTCRAR